MVDKAFQGFSTEVETSSGNHDRRQMLVRLLLRNIMVVVLIVLLIISQILYPRFFHIDNIYNILSQNAPVGIIAVGMTFVMIAGGFDLSVGALYALGAVFYATQAQNHPLFLAAALTIILGMAAGLSTGLVVTRLKVNPFVATLGMSSVLGGAAFLYSNSMPIMVHDPQFNFLGGGRWLGVPVSVYLLVTVFVVGGYVLAKTVYGRSLYAVGGNFEAARLAGIRVDLLRTSTYVLVGALSVVGGMIMASRLTMGQANIGANIALDAIAITVIGGTSLFGGTGAVWRTAVGLIILATLTNLFDSLALDSNIQSVVKGLIIIGAVSLDAVTRSRF